MNKTDLINLMTQSTGLPTPVLAQACEVANNAIINALVQNEIVDFNGFGTFSVEITQDGKKARFIPGNQLINALK